MVLKLDSAIPLVWRDPFSLQFGVDPARIVLREVSSAQERMISALLSGVSRSGLSMIARSCGAEEREVDRLLDAIGPLLVAQTTELKPPTVAIVGTGITVNRLARSIGETGARVLTAESVAAPASGQPCDLGIVVGHYVLEPASYGFWLRRDVPHLPVIFGDAAVVIGPLVEPGRGPCLYCLEHHRRDADASWSAIASQLWGRKSRTETPLVSREVAALATRLVVRRLSTADPRPRLAPAGTNPTATAFRLSTETGEIETREWTPHPDCGCITVPDAVGATAAQTGSGSPAGSLRGVNPRPPRTAAIVGGPE